MTETSIYARYSDAQHGLAKASLSAVFAGRSTRMLGFINQDRAMTKYLISFPAAAMDIPKKTGLQLERPESGNYPTQFSVG